MNPRQYVLDDKRNPIPETDIKKWGEFMSRPERIVKQETVNGADVSTVFLGLDHQYGDGPPILWETMVFGGSMDQEQDRCSGSWEQAEAMHQRMVEQVKKAAP